MEELPIDIINYLALDMNISDVINLCKTSKKFRDNICNNRIYWINKLKRDYDVTYDQSFGDPKTLYTDVRKYFSKLGISTYAGYNRKYDVNNVLNDAAAEGNINMIRIAIMKGADVNKYEYEPNVEDEEIDDSPEVITAAVLGGHPESLKYLLPLLKRQLNKNQKEFLLRLAADYSGINMVKYLVEDMKIRPDQEIIDSAKYMLGEYSDTPERFTEQQEVIKYLEDKML